MNTQVIQICKQCTLEHKNKKEEINLGTCMITNISKMNQLLYFQQFNRVVLFIKLHPSFNSITNHAGKTAKNHNLILVKLPYF